MTCDTVTMAVGVLFGPMDDLVSNSDGSLLIVTGKQDAIETAVKHVREELEQRLPEGNVFRVYIGVEKGDEKEVPEDELGDFGDGEEF